MNSTLHRITLLGLAVGALFLPACTTTYITPVAVATPTRLDRPREQEVPAGEKTFTLPNDWQWGPWIVKRGAKITFREDGTGSFACRVYAQHNTGSEMLHFQSIQYGKDGNRLFTFPGSDVGHAMAIRQPFTDYPYNADFAFDPRHYHLIENVKFYARLRLKDQHVGHYAARRSSFVQWSFLDPTRQPPRDLPAQP